jgi:hypothetical protein
MLARLDTTEGLDGLSEEDLRERLAVIDGGKGLSVERAEVIRHQLQMVLGIWATKGVLPLEVPPIATMADLYLQHADELEALAEAEGGAAALLQKHYQKTFNVAASRALFAAS